MNGGITGKLWTTSKEDKITLGKNDRDEGQGGEGEPFFPDDLQESRPGKVSKRKVR